MESLERPTQPADAAPDSDVILCSRARLARNIQGYPFVGRSSNQQRLEVLLLAKKAILSAKLDDTMLWVELNHATPRDRQLLVERHLISRHLAASAAPCGVAVSGDETLAIMINEEDHLRMQVLLPGRQVGPCFERANQVDDALERGLTYAFSDRFGYLTACPTNVGTGLRLGVMVHLPALKLTNELERLQRASRDLNLAVRGFYGEGSETTGDFYQISNQVTLGEPESQLLAEFDQVIVPRLIEYERAARRSLLEKDPRQLDDRVYRALGVLSRARLLGENEAMKLLSRVRLGACLGRVPELTAAAIDRLFPQIQTAHLQQSAGEAITNEDLLAARADLVRRAMGG